MSRIATKRLAKGEVSARCFTLNRNLNDATVLAELNDLRADGGTPTGCTLLKAEDLQEWIISLSVLGESVYAGCE